MSVFGKGVVGVLCCGVWLVWCLGNVVSGGRRGGWSSLRLQTSRILVDEEGRKQTTRRLPSGNIKRFACYRVDAVKELRYAVR